MSGSLSFNAAAGLGEGSYPPPPRTISGADRDFAAESSGPAVHDEFPPAVASVDIHSSGSHKSRSRVSATASEDEEEQKTVHLTQRGSQRSAGASGGRRVKVVSIDPVAADGAAQPILSGFIQSMLDTPNDGSQVPAHSPRSSHPLTEMVWSHLTVRAKPSRHDKEGKVLLDDVSGKLSYGLTALMGPSGSGKTTLLNTLACRLDVNTTQVGDISLNGEAYSNAELKRIAGYVMQDDLLNGYLTVQETLMYAAQLRLPSTWTEEQKEQRVDEVIYDMGLAVCRHVLIGTSDLKGISGGQKRRVCAGMQLLTRPQLLFLDEPTSGLDSVTALELVMTLHRLSASTGCTIVASIHQPQAKIFELFGHIILLKNGRVVVQGRRTALLQTFADAGFPCGLYNNPADHIMDVITTTNRTTKEEEATVEAAIAAASQTNPNLVTAASSSRPKVFASVISETEYDKNRLGWPGQFVVLFRRGMQEQWRKRNIMLTSLLQSLMMAVLIGTAFLFIGTSQSAVSKRQSVLFFCAVNQGVFGALLVINSFPSERSLTLRERASGTYYVSAYFLAKITAETVGQLCIPVMFSFVVYWLIGLQNTAGHFFVFMVFMILCSLSATSLALMVSAISRTVDMSVTILPMALEISRLFGGFFLSPKSVPGYFVWLDALSYVNYTYVGISLNELDGLLYQCPSPPTAADVCTGAAEVTALDLNYISIGGCVGALLAYIVVTRSVAFLAIRQLKS